MTSHAKNVMKFGIVSFRLLIPKYNNDNNDDDDNNNNDNNNSVIWYQNLQEPKLRGATKQNH